MNVPNLKKNATFESYTVSSTILNMRNESTIIFGIPNQQKLKFHVKTQLNGCHFTYPFSSLLHSHYVVYTHPERVYSQRLKYGVNCQKILTHR